MRTNRLIPISIITVLLCFISVLAWGVEDITRQTLADPQALAALEQAGTVFFTDDFEDGDYADWFDAYGPPEVVDDSSLAHSGNKALKCLATYKNDNSSTSSIKYWFHPGYDRVYYRWYVKFDDAFDQGWGMHFCSLYAVQGDNKWNEMGTAGQKPDGDDHRPHVATGQHTGDNDGGARGRPDGPGRRQRRFRFRPVPAA